MFPPQSHSFPRATSGVGEEDDKLGVMLVFGVGGECRDNCLEFWDGEGFVLFGLSIISPNLSAFETYTPRVRVCQMILTPPPVPTGLEVIQPFFDSAGRCRFRPSGDRILSDRLGDFNNGFII